MLFKRDDLQRAFDRVKGAVQKNSVIPVFGMVRLITNDGNYKIYGSNSTYQIVAHGECEGDDDFDLCFPTDKFGVMLSAEKDEIDITAHDGKALSKSGKSKFNFSVVHGDDYPIITMTDDTIDAIYCDGINLKTVIGTSHICAAKNDARVFLNGVSIASDGKSISATATDGRILASHKVNADIEQFNALIPIEVIKILYEVDSIGFQVKDKRSIQVLLSDGSIVISKLIDAQFPTWERTVEFETNGFFSVYSDDFKKQVSIASKASFNNAIRLSAKDCVLTISSTSNDGNFESEIECQGDEFAASFNFDVLKMAIDSIGDVDFNLEFSKDFKKFKYKRDDLVVVVMPLRA